MCLHVICDYSFTFEAVKGLRYSLTRHMSSGVSLEIFSQVIIIIIIIEIDIILIAIFKIRFQNVFLMRENMCSST